jgi:hypothetical protein
MPDKEENAHSHRSEDTPREESISGVQPHIAAPLKDDREQPWKWLVMKIGDDSDPSDEERELIQAMTVYENEWAMPTLEA